MYVHRYYNIPTISAVTSLFPLYQLQYNQNTSEWFKNVSIPNPAQNTMYFIANWHADTCCHPMAFGSKLSNDTVV